MYLEVPEEGGRWIFPLAGTPPKDGEPAERHREFVAALQDWVQKPSEDENSWRNVGLLVKGAIFKMAYM